MNLPSWEKGTVRTGSYGLAFAFALILPMILGYAVASGGTTRPPRAGELTTPQAASITTGADTDEQQVITGVPVGDAPSTAEEALTRRENAVAGIPRIRYITPETGEVRLNNGDVIPLGDDVQMTIQVSPFPPNTFKEEIEVTLTRNGEPITDAAIDTVWDMIVMGHGPFETRIPHVSDGTYATSYDFFMFGPWQLDTELQIPGIDPIEFSISIYVWPV